MEKRRIAILGSTGSIGTQAVEVILNHSDVLEAEVLIAQNNTELLIKQAIQLKPNVVVIGNEAHYEIVKQALEPYLIKVYAGAQAISDTLQMESVDMVLTATVGFSGLLPTIAAIKAGKTIAIANKETLVVAGHLVTLLAKEKGVNLLPVDSEHSAIFQCLAGEFHNPIEKIILTASGGPFRGYNSNQLSNVTLQDALKHPNWQMGAKITVDSASLMNKGLECIEALWLFGIAHNQVEVVIHKESIIHSLVQFYDGSIKAQMGLPDMKLPIQYALCYPKRMNNQFPRFNFESYKTLHFENPDFETFTCLKIAFEVMKKLGNYPCVMNAANEVAVAKFLNEEISFIDIPKIIDSALQKFEFKSNPSLEELVALDTNVRSFLK